MIDAKKFQERALKLQRDGDFEITVIGRPGQLVRKRAGNNSKGGGGVHVDIRFPNRRPSLSDDAVKALSKHLRTLIARVLSLAAAGERTPLSGRDVDQAWASARSRK